MGDCVIFFHKEIKESLLQHNLYAFALGSRNNIQFHSINIFEQRYFQFHSSKESMILCHSKPFEHVGRKKYLKTLLYLAVIGSFLFAFFFF